MIEQCITNTKIIRIEDLTARLLHKLFFYLEGEDARVCIIHDKNPIPSRDKLLREIKNSPNIKILDQVVPNPKVMDIMTMVTQLRRKAINIVVGFGGGSSLDSAKAVAALLDNGGDLEDYLGEHAMKHIKKKQIKTILIPTTAGTGSEVTKFGVYTSRSGRKYTLAHPLLQADIALLSAPQTYCLPAPVTAATAFDALSHSLEAIWNINATPLSDRVAIESATHILKWMETAYDSSISGNIEGRAEILEGACMAGIAFNLTGTAAVHALSFIFSEEWHVPHGVACAFTLEDVLELNSQNPKARNKLAMIACQLFGDGKEEELLSGLKQRLTSLKKKFNLPFRFSDLGINLKEGQVSRLFEKSLDDPKMVNNIVPVDRDMVYRIIKNKI